MERSGDLHERRPWENLRGMAVQFFCQAVYNETFRMAFHKAMRKIFDASENEIHPFVCQFEAGFSGSLFSCSSDE